MCLLKPSPQPLTKRVPMAVRIMKRTVDAIEPRDRDQFYWDNTLKGFGLKVSKAGRKVYVLQYRMGGRGSVERRITIGEHGSPWTPDDARKRAEEILRQVEDGVDPAAAKDAENIPQEAPKDTMAELLPDFIERWSKPHNRSWRENQRMINAYIQPRWKERRIGEIKRTDVVNLLDEIVARGAPIQANRVLALLRKFFNWSIERGLIESSPVNHMKAPAPENERDRWLSKAEIVNLWEACDAVGRPFGPFVKLLLLTGQRRDEVANMRWDEIDVTNRMWTITKESSKNKRSHLVPLSPAVLKIIEDLPRIPARQAMEKEKPEDVPQSAFVFTTTGATPVSGFGRIKARIDELMLKAETRRAAEEGRKPVVTPDWVFHDLRRTLATHAAEELGIAPHVVDKILNHVSGTIRGVAAVYNRAEYLEERRHALNAWAERVAELAKPPKNRKAKPSQKKPGARPAAKR